MAILGRYELRGILGEGGFATVYRAWDPNLGREVALKALFPHLASNPEVRRRFLAESRAVAALHHPNIITVYDVGETLERPYFAMELIEGRTLAVLITPGGQPAARVAEVITALASAIDYLHTMRLVHRDIKGANIMLDRSGRVVLMDFGIARALDSTQHTRTGVLLGSLETISPEQVLGLPVGPPADIYALGVLAYQLLAGRPPFSGDTAHLLYAQAHQPPPPLKDLRPGLPGVVYQAIDAALAKDPSRRPAAATMLARALGRTDTPEHATPERDPLHRSAPGGAHLAPTAPKPKRGGLRELLVVLIATLALGVVVFIIGVSLTRGSASNGGTGASAGAATATSEALLLSSPQPSLSMVPSTMAPAPQQVVSATVTEAPVTSPGQPSGPSNLTETTTDDKFSNTSYTINAGQQVTMTVKNNGQALHNWDVLGVKSTDGKDIVPTPLLVPPGQTRTVTFTIATPGTYKFQCDVHPTEMTGTLTVS